MFLSGNQFATDNSILYLWYYYLRISRNRLHTLRISRNIHTAAQRDCLGPFTSPQTLPLISVSYIGRGENGVGEGAELEVCNSELNRLCTIVFCVRLIRCSKGFHFLYSLQ
jgi:hypothetical protein